METNMNGSMNREPYQNRPAPNKTPDGDTGTAKTWWIVIGVILVIAVIGIIYGATQRSLKNSNMANEGQVPVTQNGEVAGDRVSEPVTYTGFDVVNLQTFPYRVQVRVRGTVPEGCAVAGTPTATVSGKVFTVTMDASKPADAVCTQVVTNVEGVVELPVSGLAAGTYSVKVGTMPAKSFTLAVNNTIQYTGDK